MLNSVPDPGQEALVRYISVGKNTYQKEGLMEGMEVEEDILS